MPIVGKERGLSAEDIKTLKYFKYDEATNKLEATRTVATEPATVEVGNHGISSMGENFGFINKLSNIIWAPSWQGIKPQHIVENQDHTGVIPPTFRHYTSDYFMTEIDGAPHASAYVEYNANSTVASNVSVFAQECIVGEDITPEDWLTYTTEALKDDGVTYQLVYQQTLTGISLSTGSTLHWDFDHPVEGRAGQQIRSRLYIAKGNQDAGKNLLQVRGLASDPTRRYVNVGMRSFTDEDVMSGVIFTTASRVIRYAATYAVDTSISTITLTVDNTVGYNSFMVFDAGETFNVTKPCIIDFGAIQGTATLQTKNDSFLFYWDGSQWRYLDMNTKTGGIV